jgi:GxxExxY protein
MLIELRSEGLEVKSEWRVPLKYKGWGIRTDLRIDLLVNGCVVLEIKAVEQLHPVHLAQVITYLKLAGCPLGFLMNFNSTVLKAGLKRLDHPDLYVNRKNSPRSF